MRRPEVASKALLMPPPGTANMAGYADGDGQEFMPTLAYTMHGRADV